MWHKPICAIKHANMPAINVIKHPITINAEESAPVSCPAITTNIRNIIAGKIKYTISTMTTFTPSTNMLIKSSKSGNGSLPLITPCTA